MWVTLENNVNNCTHDRSRALMSGHWCHRKIPLTFSIKKCLHYTKYDTRESLMSRILCTYSINKYLTAEIVLFIRKKNNTDRSSSIDCQLIAGLWEHAFIYSILIHPGCFSSDRLPFPRWFIASKAAVLHSLSCTLSHTNSRTHVHCANFYNINFYNARYEKSSLMRLLHSANTAMRYRHWLW